MFESQGKLQDGGVDVGLGVGALSERGSRDGGGEGSEAGDDGGGAHGEEVGGEELDEEGVEKEERGRSMSEPLL